jgi:hypothetical protein
LVHARVWIRSRLRRTSSSSVDPAASDSIAKLKDARSRVVLGDAKGDGTEPTTVSPVPQSLDQASNAVASGDAEEGAKPLASRLLDARRKRRE